MKTRVIFRRYRDGEILALFPYESATVSPHFCQCYSHVGQHGAADPITVYNTKPARPSEYKALAAELRRIGYKLEIGRRIPRNAYIVRAAQLRGIIARARSS